MNSAILGISAYYHDSAAALLVNGEVIAAAQEERFTRVKHDSSFPHNAIKFVLQYGGVEINELDVIVFYDKPYIKFERLLETYHTFPYTSLKSFLSSIPVWIKEKLFMKKILKEELSKLGGPIPRVLFPEHHMSHAASAFFPSPFADAAILTIDGVGEWATTTICDGYDNKITMLKELKFPHSIGLLYSAFTYYCGFRVNSGEYKLMGLAPYGDPDSEETKLFKKKITDEIVDIRDDGSILLNMKYFKFATGLRMCDDKKWEKLFNLPKRDFESEITPQYMNLALAIQQVTEEIVLKLAKTAQNLTGRKNLVMAGGVALNCVANGKLLRSKIFDDIWVQPAAGDAGGALGAAYAAWHVWKGESRNVVPGKDSMKGAFLGPEFSSLDITQVTRKYNAAYTCYENDDEFYSYVADRISEGKVIGWFQGRMEYGPRALGNRSILGDPRHPEMQKKLNLKIKYREGFRPFAPSVLEESISTYFDLEGTSPYMLIVAPVKKERRTVLPEKYDSMGMMERLYHLRSDVPAITHIDYSARIQSINKDVNSRYWNLINTFKEKTGYGLVVNTSFNVRGEPVVCTPDDAYRCFMRTEMDVLVLGSFIFVKEEQPEFADKTNWQEKFKLD